MNDELPLAAAVEPEIPVAVSVEPAHTWLYRGWASVSRAAEWLFGVASLVVGLAFLATIPFVQMLSLGYLLEATRRVVLSGRFRDGFPGVRLAARVGGVVAGSVLTLGPLTLVSSLWYDALQIDPAGRIAANWRVGLIATTGLTVVHLLAAWYSGGRLRHFVWPLCLPAIFVAWAVRKVLSWLQGSSLAPSGGWRAQLLDDLCHERPISQWWFVPSSVLARWRRGERYVFVRDCLWEHVAAMRLPVLFWLGLRGFAGAMAWLIVPVLVFIGSTKSPEGPAAVFTGLFGAALLSFVLVHLPFLQTHFASEGKLSAIWDLTTVRQLFRRAPLAFWLALFVTLLFATPLYLLKLELTPREIAWLPGLVFVLFIWPARLVTGWAMARARRWPQPRFFLSRWLARGLAVPVLAAYVLIVYLTQFTSATGSWSIFEQHAFLVPVPFLGM